MNPNPQTGPVREHTPSPDPVHFPLPRHFSFSSVSLLFPLKRNPPSFSSSVLHSVPHFLLSFAPAQLRYQSFTEIKDVTILSFRRHFSIEWERFSCAILQYYQSPTPSAGQVCSSVIFVLTHLQTTRRIRNLEFCFLRPWAATAFLDPICLSLLSTSLVSRLFPSSIFPALEK